MTASSRTTRTRRSVAAQRGSVLLMVVAVLALLAIIAVSYSTLGRADRASSSALVRENRVDDQASLIADYLASVIGNDVMSVYTQNDDNGGFVFRRAATDSPGTSGALVSENDPAYLNAGFTRFNPNGIYAGLWTAAGPDQRRPSDPWLAPVEPEYLPPHSAALPTGAFNLSDIDLWRTWRFISNFAPDGRFVNLYNLRGNFNAQPGVNGGPPWRMSDRLSVLDENGNPTTTSPLTGNPIDPLIPADFSTYQFMSFRPMTDDRLPGDATDGPDHVNNQWADADGDGFADSRWFELVDAFFPDELRWILPQTGRHRLFVAARATDLSALMNVNVHGDFLYEPESQTDASGNLVQYPAGLTPADVDLRRFLMMYDISWQFGGAGTSYSYDRFPTRANIGVADYSGFDRDEGYVSGRTAYAAIRRAIETGEVLPAGDTRATDMTGALAWNTNENTPNALNPNPLDSEARARLFDAFGADPSAARIAAGSTTSRSVRAPFGMSDELELRTFNGINDSDRRSKLELVTGGRESEEYGVLRENRPRAIEMLGRTESGGLPTNAAVFSAFADIRHLLTTASAARPLMESPLGDANPNGLTPADVKVDMIALLSRFEQPIATPPTQADVQSLFSLYADALAPYTDLTRFPDAWEPFASVSSARGLSYGESAELAVRASGHLTANTMDAADREPEFADGRTLDLSFPTRIQLEVVSGAPTDPRLEPTLVVGLDDARRPAVGDGDHVGSPRLNIYGIEAQPFVIEAAWYGVFTDSPYDAGHTGQGADNDFADGYEPPNPPTQPDEDFGPITIDDEADPDNRDFVFEVLAFQLTNPFDRDLLISPAGRVTYYIEYANRYFALAFRNDDGTGILDRDVIIEANKTRVFYVCNIRNPEDVASRIEAAEYAPAGGGPVPSDYLKAWATQQFGADAVPVPMVHPTTLSVCPGTPHSFGSAGVTLISDIFGERQVPTGAAGEPGQDAIGTAVGSSNSQRQVVYLWRRPPGAPTTGERDILVDRLRDDPASGVDGTIWAQRKVSASDQVPDTEAGDDTDANNANDLDNTGFSITKWAAFRRATDPTNYRRGSMPAWAIEVKDPSPQLSEYTTTLNDGQRAPTGGLGSGTDYRGFGADRNERHSTLRNLATAQSTTSTLNTAIRAEARNKTGNDIGSNQSIPARPFGEVAVQIHLSGGNANPQLFSRAGDFLLPLAIGPSYDPLRPIPAGLNANLRVDQLEARWMTLSEALALACDYYSPTFAADPVLYRLGRRDDNAGIRPRLDRGNLVINDFAPYRDNNDNGAFEPDTDDRLGRGVPLALNIVDMVNTADRLTAGPSGPVSRRIARGGPRNAISGLININTAPVSVLRMVPMFAPGPDPDPENWLIGTAGTPVYSPGADQFDIASALVGYRDKSIVNPRPRTAGTTAAADQMDFRDTDPPGSGGNPPDGRFKATRVAAINEDPGFKSIGEILAVRYHDPNAGTPTRLYENSIDRFANPASNTQDKRALESTLWKNDTGIYEADAMANEYDEQLAIANAAFNSISVRSDVFCVWFLIHGYLPSDVENLGPADPMIPSIARRYVMVVDRSNVVALGQKPKILLFQEVPIR